MPDEMLIWILAAVLYAAGVWHGWIIGGTFEIRKQTREIQRGIEAITRTRRLEERHADSTDLEGRP